ncbi:MAG: polysaccharide deacetylase family protein [Candidatus Hodarchaeota archaeon]
MTINVAICMDIDRDAAFPKKGVTHGVSLTSHYRSSNEWKDPKKFSLKGTIKGIYNLLTIFEEINLPLTLFIEAGVIEKTIEEIPNFFSTFRGTGSDFGLHGLYHEDLTGIESGVLISRHQENLILEKALRIFRRSFNQEPVGFRAPYLKLSENTLELLAKNRFLYDSSVIKTANHVPHIYENKNHKIVEVPILRYETDSKPFILYLWTLFEFIRPVNQIIKMIQNIINNTKKFESYNETKEPSILTINFHPWHLSYYIKEKRYFTEQEVRGNIKNFLKILETLIQTEGVKFVSISEVINNWHKNID